MENDQKLNLDDVLNLTQPNLKKEDDSIFCLLMMLLLLRSNSFLSNQMSRKELVNIINNSDLNNTEKSKIISILLK